MKFTEANGTRKDYSEGGNQDLERRIWYVNTYRCILTVKNNHATIHRPKEVK